MPVSASDHRNRDHARTRHARFRSLRMEESRAPSSEASSGRIGVACRHPRGRNGARRAERRAPLGRLLPVAAFAMTRRRYRPQTAMRPWPAAAFIVRSPPSGDLDPTPPRRQNSAHFVISIRHRICLANLLRPLLPTTKPGSRIFSKSAPTARPGEIIRGRPELPTGSTA